MIRVAAIDVGTNSIHLLVAEVAPDGTRRVLDRGRAQVMLGSGGINEHRLTEDAWARGMEALRQFKEAADGWEVADVHAAATSAVREAANGTAFRHAVKAQLGLHVRVITGLEEGRMIWLGARDEIDTSRGPVMLCDLGGGSTELIVADGSGLSHVVSLPVGHIRLADQHPFDRTLTPDIRRAMKKTVRGLLQPVRKRIPEGFVGSLVGTSGTLRTLARMATARRGDALPEHGTGLVLTRDELEDLLDVFRERPKDTWDDFEGFDPKRRDTLAAGAVITREVMKGFGLDRLTTSERSLRDGLIVDWIERHRPEIDLSGTIDDPRERSIQLTMDRFGADRAHAEHVAELALSLYDQLGPLHQLPLPDRDLLRAAALLHDIGHHIDPKNHHKHGQYLLSHIPLHGFTAPDVAVLSNVVRYHSRSMPKSHHHAWRTLSGDDRRRVRLLAGMLKIADGLDRSHAQPVDTLVVDHADRTVTVRAHTVEDGALERWAAVDRTKLLSKALGRPVEVEIVADAAPDPT